MSDDNNGIILELGMKLHEKIDIMFTVTGMISVL